LNTLVKLAWLYGNGKCLTANKLSLATLEKYSLGGSTINMATLAVDLQRLLALLLLNGSYVFHRRRCGDVCVRVML